MSSSQDLPITSATPEPPGVLAALRVRAKRLVDWQRRRVETLETVVSRQLDQVDRVLALQQSQAAIPSEEAKTLRQRLAQATKALQARSEELKQLRGRCESPAEQAAADFAEELAEVRGERDQLQARLETAEQKSEEDARELEELRGRLEELAALQGEREQLHDRLREAERLLAENHDSGNNEEFEAELEAFRMRLEELTSVNRELEERLQAATASSNDESPGSAFSWEQQKAKLMQQLEGFDDSERQQAEDKLTVESTIRITDQVVAEKDREIADLLQRLEQRDARYSESGSTDDSSAQSFDHHEGLRTEHEKLVALQEEWRAKLREAEVEISVQRAKLARERNELEEQLRALERQQQEFSGGKSAGKSGRWLSRLGLKEEE